mgnify:CR=1 FL=1
MTREEAKEKLYREWQRFLEDNIDYAGISEAYKMAFKSLEQEPVIDKIRTEIEQLPTTKCTETSRIYIDADDFKKNVIALSLLAKEKGKPVGVTETGLENNHTADYWTKDCLPALKGQWCSMVVAWRNEKPSHAFGPYPSDVSADDFRLFHAHNFAQIPDSERNRFIAHSLDKLPDQIVGGNHNIHKAPVLALSHHPEGGLIQQVFFAVVFNGRDQGIFGLGGEEPVLNAIISQNRRCQTVM